MTVTVRISGTENDVNSVLPTTPILMIVVLVMLLLVTTVTILTAASNAPMTPTVLRTQLLSLVSIPIASASVCMLGMAVTARSVRLASIT